MIHLFDRPKSGFDRAKNYLGGHHDRRPAVRYFEPWLLVVRDQRNERTNQLSFEGSTLKFWVTIFLPSQAHFSYLWETPIGRNQRKMTMWAWQQGNSLLLTLSHPAVFFKITPTAVANELCISLHHSLVVLYVFAGVRESRSHHSLSVFQFLAVGLWIASRLSKILS